MAIETVNGVRLRYGMSGSPTSATSHTWRTRPSTSRQSRRSSRSWNGP